MLPFSSKQFRDRRSSFSIRLLPWLPWITRTPCYVLSPGTFAHPSVTWLRYLHMSEGALSTSISFVSVGIFVLLWRKERNFAVIETKCNLRVQGMKGGGTSNIWQLRILVNISRCCDVIQTSTSKQNFLISRELFSTTTMQKKSNILVIFWSPHLKKLPTSRVYK